MTEYDLEVPRKFVAKRSVEVIEMSGMLGMNGGPECYIQISHPLNDGGADIHAACAGSCQELRGRPQRITVGCKV